MLVHVRTYRDADTHIIYIHLRTHIIYIQLRTHIIYIQLRTHIIYIQLGTHILKRRKASAERGASDRYM